MLLSLWTVAACAGLYAAGLLVWLRSARPKWAEYAAMLLPATVFWVTIIGYLIGMIDGGPIYPVVVLYSWALSRSVFFVAAYRRRPMPVAIGFATAIGALAFLFWLLA